MIDCVFISDLHLHPQEPEIQARFDSFLEWAKGRVKTIYILGDFFHAWPGDDYVDAWSAAIAKQLKELADSGISLFYMHGNRDFLLGPQFAQQAGWTLLKDPTVIQLHGENILLAHGDRWCIKDKSHQLFLKLTRNKYFAWLFLLLPLKYRVGMMNKVRSLSRQNKTKSAEQMDVVEAAVLHSMKKNQLFTVIHGHTHKPGLVKPAALYKRFVLSDWDDNPQPLCYNDAKGFFYLQNQV